MLGISEVVGAQSQNRAYFNNSRVSNNGKAVQQQNDSSGRSKIVHHNPYESIPTTVIIN